MKTLKTLQTISKVGRVISKIVFIACIVGFCGCVSGIITVAAGAEGIKFNDVTLKSLLQTEADITTGTLYALMAAGMIICASECVLAKFAEHYFSRELSDGTPFTFGGAKEMFRLGVLTICIPVGAQILSAIAVAIISASIEGVADLNFSDTTSFALGIAFLVASAVFKHGAELAEALKAANAAGDAEPTEPFNGDNI